MRRMLIALAVLAGFVFAMAAAGLAAGKAAPANPPPYTGLKKRIAVLPITVGGGSATISSAGGGESATTVVATGSEPMPGDLGASLTEQLTTALINTGRFVVLERKALGDVLGEQDLGASGRVNKETAAPVGRVIGAEWMIKAAITEYSSKKSRSGGGILLRGFGIGGEKREAYVALDVRIVDATTGEVLDSVKADGRARSSGTLGGVSIGGVVLAGGKEDSTPIGQATRAALTDAVDFICQRMDQIAWSSRVTEVEGDEIIISGGSNMNLKVGDLFTVCHRGKPLVDPETGQTLGYRETEIGAIKVTEVQDKFSICTMIAGKTPERGDVVRTNTPPPPPAQPKTQ